MDKSDSPNQKSAPSVARRHNSGKPQWSLMDFTILESAVRVMEEGAKKYSRNNWRRGHPIQDLVDSAQRHLVAISSGEIIDPEDGLPHWAKLITNAMFMGHSLRLIESGQGMHLLSQEEVKSQLDFSLEAMAIAQQSGPLSTVIEEIQEENEGLGLLEMMRKSGPPRRM